jgi:serine/threonine-protein kinase RsbW
MASAPMESNTTPAITLETTAHGFRARLSATLESIDAADAAVTGFLSEHDVPVDRFAVRILLREALLNAVTHGSDACPAREVRLELARDDDALVLTVVDDGPGFDWRQHSGEHDTLGDGGRGLALMLLFAAQVTFNERGNAVTLRCAYDSGVRQSQG